MRPRIGATSTLSLISARRRSASAAAAAMVDWERPTSARAPSRSALAPVSCARAPVTSARVESALDESICDSCSLTAPRATSFSIGPIAAARNYSPPAWQRFRTAGRRCQLVSWIRRQRRRLAVLSLPHFGFGGAKLGFQRLGVHARDDLTGLHRVALVDEHFLDPARVLGRDEQLIGFKAAIARCEPEGSDGFDRARHATNPTMAAIMAMMIQALRDSPRNCARVSL